MEETPEQTVQRLKEQHRHRSKRCYQKKRERKQCDDDSDASSVVSLPTKRRHADDVSILHEELREAVYTAIEEKEKEKEKEQPKTWGRVENKIAQGGGVRSFVRS